MATTGLPRSDTRLKIIRLAAELYLDQGYSKTSNNKIASMLGLSPGNITFYFPTKDHLLAVLVDELFDFQNLFMETAAAEGKSSLLAYCLELTTMAAACEENPIIRDFFRSAYSSELTLDLIRGNDADKTSQIFSEFCPGWTAERWLATENIVSGIEFATIMTGESSTPLDVQIERTLNSILLIYGVPEELRQIKIKKVLSMDYRALGHRVLKEFKEYIKTVNEANLKEYSQHRRRRVLSQYYAESSEGTV